MEEFKVNIAQPVLDDLKAKIKNTRWTDEILNSGWTYGASMPYMKELAHYWMDGFDWRKTESQINAFPNFMADIDGYPIHALHIKGNGKKSLPLIITHGWPGSFLEMMKLIPLLTNDEDFSIDLVIPSLPGFGFSGRVTHPGCNAWLIAELWVKLMKQLGYDKFLVQGGDFGAAVATALGLRHAEHVLAVHVNYIPGSYKPWLPPGEDLREEELPFQKKLASWLEAEGGYSHLHRTKPLTLAYGLNDSPVGLCAWITEKFHGWSAPKENNEQAFTADELLDNVTLYWVTETIHSSIRLYNENSKAPFHFGEKDFVQMPVGVSRFPFEAPFPPRQYIERGYNIQHWTDQPAGGHFAALEQPELLANDIKQFSEIFR